MSEVIPETNVSKIVGAGMKITSIGDSIKKVESISELVGVTMTFGMNNANDVPVINENKKINRIK